MMLYQIMRQQKCKEQICPVVEQKTIVRYIPKTIEEEQLYGESASEVFKTMFSRPSPFVQMIGNYDRKTGEDHKNYFISQA